MYNEYNFYNDNDSEKDGSSYTGTPQSYDYYIDSDIVGDSSSRSGSGKDPKKKKKGSGMSLAKKFALCASFAAVFGLVAGGVAVGTTRLASSSASSTAQTVQTAANADSSVATNNTVASSSTTNGSTASVGTTSSDTSSEMTVEEVSSNSMPALVSITNKSIQEVQNYFGGMGGFGNNSGTQEYEETSMGSGVIIGQTDSVIYIVTNEHVIDSAQTLTVAFVDDSTASGTVIGSDSTNDIAVVSVNKSDLSSDTLSQIKVMEIGDSDSLVVGQQVVAIGNALGYGQSVSEGIVSALNRSMDGGTGIYAEGLIQTDAAINPGNSGGALLNMNGQLIGINSAKYADTEVEGMGYSIPINKVEPIIEEMINGTYTSTDSSSTDTNTNSSQNGSNNQNGNNSGSNSTDGNVQVSSDAYLGVSCTGISSEYSQYYNIPEGVYISEVVSGSAADKAGLKQGDIITAIDGTSISSVDELSSIMSSHSSGDTVSMTISRQSSSGSYASSTVSVTFGSSSSSQQKTSYNMQ
ncbi:MAG: trypsin-like peptidase domain-containing protein [Lachnospiraceae bacterium]|nr:trypsin-like peptidase domain-containing protein [Lachnospiraceae bacterium]MCI1727210.1 trypsin-like peptidase domain-containing protein [Lachnospiraceae bacterium]